MVPKITWGTCRWTDKEHFPVRMYSHSMRGTKVTATAGWWLLSKLPECSAPKTQMTALRLVHALLIYSPTLCISIMFVTSLNDITIICFPLLAGKALHMCRRAMPVCLCTHWHPHWLFSTATHEPFCQFHIPYFEPVTLSSRYFSVPSYQSLYLLKQHVKQFVYKRWYMSEHSCQVKHSK